MSQMIFNPPVELQQDVKCFWILEEAQDVYNRNEIIPDSYADLIINCGTPLFLEAEYGVSLELPSAYLCRMQMRARRLRTLGPSQVIAVRLYPWAVPSLVDIEIAQTHLEYMALNSVWKRFANSIQRSLCRKEYAEAVACLQQFVLEQWVDIPRHVAPVRTAGQMLFAARGQMSMAALADHCFLSQSRFERQFKYFTGVTPKIYARLVRFEAACNALVVNPSYSLVDLALEFGYTDQAHLTHDFNVFTAHTPKVIAARAKAYTAQCHIDDFLQDS